LTLGCPLLSEQVEGADPVGVVVGDRGDEQFVGVGGVAEEAELVGDAVRGADELGIDAVGDEVACSRPSLPRASRASTCDADPTPHRAGLLVGCRVPAR
jgi:hypothetical protein